MGVDRTLPREEFFYRQLVSSADFLKAYHASAHSTDDYGLAPGHPAFCIGGRQIEVAIFRTGVMRQKRAFIRHAPVIAENGCRNVKFYRINSDFQDARDQREQPLRFEEIIDTRSYLPERL